jgi:hypothetical protein
VPRLTRQTLRIDGPMKNISPKVALSLLLLVCLDVVPGQTGVAADSADLPAIPGAEEPVRYDGAMAAPIGWQAQCPLDTMDCDPCGGCCCGSGSCHVASLSLERLGLLRNLSRRERIAYGAAVSTSASFLTLAMLAFLVAR